MSHHRIIEWLGLGNHKNHQVPTALPQAGPPSSTYSTIPSCQGPSSTWPWTPLKAKYRGRKWGQKESNGLGALSPLLGLILVDFYLYFSGKGIILGLVEYSHKDHVLSPNVCVAETLWAYPYQKVHRGKLHQGGISRKKWLSCESQPLNRI